MLSISFVIMAKFLQNIRSMLLHGQRRVYWRSSLVTLPQTLWQNNEDVTHLQCYLQDVSTDGQMSYADMIELLIRYISVVETENCVFSYIRTVLEVFILFSITTSELIWMSDKRFLHLINKLKYSLIQNFPVKFL